MTEAPIEIPARRGKAAFVARRPDRHRHQHPWRAGRRHLGVQSRRPHRVHVDGAHAGATSLHLIPQPRRYPAHQPAPADPDLDRRYLRRHPRHADRRLRPLSLRVARLRRTITTTAPTISLAGMRELGLMPPETPSPLNLFMNIPWTPRRQLVVRGPPRSMPGSYVRAARRDGSGDRVFRLSAGHPADQRQGRKTGRGAFYHQLNQQGDSRSDA